MKANYQTAADVFDSWREDVVTGKPPVLYPLGTIEGLGQITIGPGLVTLLGGAPGAGKTAFLMQGLVDALRLNQSLRVCVCNVEMSPAVLLDRQLARLSGIDLHTIRHRKFGPEHTDRLDQALNTLEAVAERLCFVRPPFDLANVAAVGDACEADVIVLDYIQRILPPGTHGDKRGSVDATMNYLRQFADNGVAVVAAAAVGRTKDAKGRSSYDGDGLNLASFRESSELEFGADDAFLLVPMPKQADAIILRQLKARHSEPRDIELTFDRARQSFKPIERGTVWNPNADHPPPTKRKLQSALAAMWNDTAAAGDDEHEGGDDE